MTEKRCLHCGHKEEEHYNGWGDCNHGDCVCVMYEPEEVAVYDVKWLLTELENDV